jgi:hypothetical protein
VYDVALGTWPSRTRERDIRTEAGLCRMVDRLYQRICPHTSPMERRATVDAIVELGMQPEIRKALEGRRDPGIAAKDLATSYAFKALLEQGRAIGRLDPLSQALIVATLDLIHKRAEKLAARLGENPLEEDHGLLLAICKSLAGYVPRYPMGFYITWKLKRYEGATSRAMRQVKNLMRHPEVTEAFVAFLLEADAPDELKGRLATYARGGALEGVDYADVIRFFAQPETVAFVKRFAATVQTARTLYAEEEYEGIAWRGKRRLPAGRRQGYLDAALARLGQDHLQSLDDPTAVDWYDTVAGEVQDPGAGLDGLCLRRVSFERWVTRQALDARPDDPLWQAASLLYEQGLRPEEAVARGLAGAETLAAARTRVEALQADPDVRGAWMASTLR